MIEVDFEQTFRGTRDKFWQILFHPKYPEALRGKVGVKEFELIELTDHGDRIVRVIRSIPERDLPAAIRKITGANLIYTEHATLYKAEHRHEYQVILEKLSKRADIRGQYILEDVEPGVIKRRLRATISISLPLIGKKVEKAVAEDLQKTLTITAGVIQEWLDNELPPR